MNNQKHFTVYRSSAGSGKTFALSRKYLSILLRANNPTYFRHILAITFTVKAANEMKERIMRYLHGFASSDNTANDVKTMGDLLCEELNISEEELHHRSVACKSHILHNYSDFAVQTIDRFVSRLARSFSSDLDIQSDAELVIDTGYLQDLSITTLMDRMGKDPQISKVLLAYAKHQLNEEKSWDMSQSLTNLFKVIESEQHFFKPEIREQLRPESVLDWISDIKAHHAKVRNQVIDAGEQAIQIIESHGLTAQDFFYGNKGIFGLFQNARSGGKYEFKKHSTKTLLEDHWSTKAPSQALLEAIPALKPLAQQLWDLEKEVSAAEAWSSLIPALYQMCVMNALEEIYKDEKEEAGVKTLSDFYQNLANKLVNEHAEFLFERIGNRFHHILFDEFQDTSKLQWLTIKPLLINGLAEGHESLLVGDAKQSIYRFRESDASLFVNIPEDGMGNNTLLEASYNEVVLDNNYRSSPIVIDFNNRLFSAIKDHIIPEAYSKTYEHIVQNPINDSRGSVYFKLFPNDDSVDQAREVIMNAMASDIAQKIESNQAEPGSMAVLFEKNSLCSAFAAKLMEKGVRVSSDESLKVHNDERSKLLIQSLSLLAEPSNEFIGQQWLVMLYHCQLIDQAQHAVLAKALKKMPLSREQILSRLNCPPVEAIGGPFYQGVAIVRGLGWDAHDPFLQTTLDFLLDYEKKQTYLKQSLLEEWQRLKNKINIPLATENAVRVLTIHKSKGLEFDRVYVALMAPPANDNALHTLELDYHGSIRPVIAKLTSTVGELAPMDAAIEKEAKKLDEINKAYVAFTRAVNHLSIYTLQGSKNKALMYDFLSPLLQWEAYDASSNELMLSA